MLMDLFTGGKKLLFCGAKYLATTAVFLFFSELLIWGAFLGVGSPWRSFIGQGTAVCGRQRAARRGAGTGSGATKRLCHSRDKRGSSRAIAT